MPRRKPESESKESALSTERGQLGVKVPKAEQKAWINRQGEGKASYEELVAETSKEKARQAIQSAGVAERKAGANVIQSYHEGGVIPRDGVYRLQKGEIVTPCQPCSGYYETNDAGDVVFKEVKGK